MLRKLGYVALATAFVASVALVHAHAQGGPEQAVSTALGTCADNTCPQNVVARVEVGPEPWSVVPAGGSIWVSNDLGVARVDPNTNGVEATVPVGGVGDVAAGDGSVWVASYSRNRVGQVDIATNSVPHPVSVDGPSGLVVGEGAVWVVSPVQGKVTRIDPITGAVVATIVVAKPAPGLNGLAVPGAGSIAVGAGAVWATMENTGEVTRIDPDTNRVVATIKAGSYPSVAFADGALWLIRDDDQTLRRIDPATNRVVATIPLHATPYELSATDGALWVTGNELIAKIDTSANTISERILAAEGIYAGLVAQGGNLWVARLASISSIDAYEPDEHVLRLELGSASTLPVLVTRGVPYTQSVACGYYTSPNGTCTLETDVYSTPGADREPIVILAHGGPCALGCHHYLAQLASALSLEGTIVFNVDYRQGKSAKDSYRDLACAIRFARANASLYGGDPGRVTLVGQSNGSVVGTTVALAGDDFKGGCLAKGLGSPDAFVGLSGGPAPDAFSYVGRNKHLKFRYIVGSKDPDTPNAERARMAAFVRTLRRAGYDSTYTLVNGADHYSTFTPGSASPTLQIILNVARNAPSATRGSS